MSKFGLFVSLFFQFCFFLSASGQILKGTVEKIEGERRVPVQNARVSIDGGQSVNTLLNGEFEFKEREISDTPRIVRVNKEGLVLKDWVYNNGKLSITMIRPQQLKGRVLSNRNIPIEGLLVTILGVRSLPPVATDAEGYFSLTIPQDIEIGQETKFLAYDAGRLGLNSKVNFEIKQSENDDIVYLFVDIPPKPVREIKVVDQFQVPVADVTVIVDNQYRYVTGVDGLVRPDADITNFSAFLTQEFQILSLDYEDAGSVMRVAVRTLEGGEEAKALTFGENKKVDIVNEALSNLIQTQADVESEIENIQKQLENPYITPEERARLQERLSELRSELANVTAFLLATTERAQEVFEELRIENKNTQDYLEEALETIETQKENEELQAQQTRLTYGIFSILAIALLSIAAIFYFNGRKISKQKDQLAENNRMLEETAVIMDQKNRQINEKNEQLVEKTNELEETNNKITDSIRYAETIQKSILPSTEQIQTAFPESFIFFRPRDIVSGDFYWYSRKGDDFIITAADCTGHGVPGAFMTMMGNTLLNQIINESNNLDPAEILTTMNEQVQITLRQRQAGENRDGDGMDMSLIRINRVKNEVVFAGAKNPLYYVQDGELFYMKGTNISIGSTLKAKNREFKNHTIPLKGGEIFYLVSDGFQDQLGGNSNDPSIRRKKYMKTKFIDFIYRCSQYPLLEQEALFEQEFDNWRGDNSQTDDVVVIGLKV